MKDSIVGRRPLRAIMVLLVGVVALAASPSRLLSSVGRAGEDGSFEVPRGAFFGDLIFADGFESGDTGAWSLTVGQGLQLDPVSDRMVPLGQSLQLSLTASEATGPVQFAVEPLPLPSGATLNAATGSFSFQPGSDQVGSFDLTFTVSDTLRSDSETVTITVTHPGGGTSLSGRLLDANDGSRGTVTPIVGATVSLLGTGFSAVTDLNGEFLLSGPPSGPQVLDLDTSTAAPAPDGSLYAGFRELFTLLDGVPNVVERPFYLPRMAMDSMTTVDPTQITMVVNTDLGVTLEVPAFSAKNSDGSDFTGQLSISEVPEGFEPAAMPEELRPGLLVTIQPVGVVFDIPAPLTITDLDGLTPGSAMDLWSVDPDLGVFTIVGLGEVQGDGTIDTMSGGIRAADWHMFLPPVASTSGSGDGDSPCKGCCGPQGCSIGSTVTLKTGELWEEVMLPTYVSQGLHRGLRFRYGSQRAHPTQMVPVEVTIPESQPVPPLISYRLRVGGVDQADVVFVDTSVLDEGFDETIRLSAFYDAAHLSTGVYPVSILTTNHFPASQVSANPRDRIQVVNESGSAFGAGWGLASLQRIYEQPDGGVLLVDGDGTSLRFTRRFEPIDLSGWQEGFTYPPGTFREAIWQLAPDNLSVSQIEPSAFAASTFVSPEEFIDVEMVIRMSTVAFDDDHIGFVLGYRTPVVGDGDDEGDMSYLLFDWKELQTGQSCGVAPEGSRLARIEGYVAPGDATCVFTTLPGPQARVLATDLGAGRGYQPDTEHEVRVVYERSRIQIDIDGERVYDVSGLFAPGRIGFYNYSQRDTTYEVAFPTDATVLEGPPGDSSTITRNGDGTYTRTFPRGMVYEYDAAGRLTSVSDRNGNTTTYGYGGGLLTTITDPLGLETTFVYAGGLLVSATDPAGRTTFFAHDANGNLIDVTYPDLATRSFEYDSEHRLVAQTDRRGFETSYVFDAFGRLESSMLPDGAERLTSNVQEVGLVDTSGGLGSETNPAPIVRPDVAVSTFLDGEGRALSMDGDAFGQAAEVTDSAGLVTRREFSPDGPQTRLETPSGHIQTATYDGFGNRSSVSDIELGGTYGFTYEPTFQQLETITDPFGMVTTISHDASGNAASVTTPEGRADTFTYTAEGQLDTWTDRLLTVTDLTYDAEGRIERIDQGTGPELRTTGITWMSSGLPDVVTDPESRTTSFGYDAVGRPISMTLPDGEVIAAGHDSRGDLTSFTPPGRPAHTFSYTENGELASYQPPAIGGAVDTLYAYNLAGQLTQVDLPDGRTITYDHDAAGRLASRQLARGTTTFTWDPVSGHLASITAPGGEVLAFTYQGDLLVGRSWSGPVAGSTSWSFDGAERLATESVNGGNQVTYGYDDDHLVTAAGSLTITRDAATGLTTGSTLGMVTDGWTYNDFGEVTSYQASYDGTPVYGYSLTRDKLGRITAETETVQAVVVDYDYAYDLRGRLDQVEVDTVLAADYDYDANGNRLSRNDGMVVEAGTYDDQDRAVSYDGVVFTYRQSGELLTRVDGANATTYDYDELGNLISITRPDGVVVSYVIDGAGRRVGKRIDGTLVQGLLYRDELFPLAELDGVGALVSRFVYGTRAHVPDYMARAGSIYRLVSDQIGSVRLVVDTSTGAVAQRLDYDEFGRVLLDSNPGFQPFGFAGGVYDPDTALVRFGARDYDPHTGRWTAKDPMLFTGGENLYEYARSNPLGRVDPSGLSPADQVVKIKAGLDSLRSDVDNTSSVFDQQITGDNFDQTMRRHHLKTRDDFVDTAKTAGETGCSTPGSLTNPAPTGVVDVVIDIVKDVFSYISSFF